MCGKTASNFVIFIHCLFLISACDSNSKQKENAGVNAFRCFSEGQKVALGVPCRSRDVGVVKVTYFDDEDNPSVCSGTLIAVDQVLSAAHCLNGAVYRGTVTTDEVSVEIEDAYIHPDFRFDGKRFHYDLAVLTLRKEITQVPIVKIDTDADIRPGDELYIGGVGVSDLSDPTSYGSLRVGSLLIGEVAPDFIYAPFDPRRDTTCIGDSGGGLFRLDDEKPVQVGVVSSGTQEECGKGDTNVFTNLSDTNLKFFLNDPLQNGRQFSSNPY